MGVTSEHGKSEWPEIRCQVQVVSGELDIRVWTQQRCLG